MHGIHTVLAQQRQPGLASSPARIDRTAAVEAADSALARANTSKHTGERIIELKLRTNHKRG